jgi:hypothetical protein
LLGPLVINAERNLNSDETDVDLGKYGNLHLMSLMIRLTTFQSNAKQHAIHLNQQTIAVESHTKSAFFQMQS